MGYINKSKSFQEFMNIKLVLHNVETFKKINDL